MPRPLFVITPSDYMHASEYVLNRLRLRKFELVDSVSHSQAEGRLLSTLGSAAKSKEQAAKLQVWCEKHLSKKDWSDLKTSIRKRRQRWKQTESSKSITISNDVHALLSRLAERDGVTFNEVLKFSLKQTARSFRKIPTSNKAKS